MTTLLLEAVVLIGFITFVIVVTVLTWSAVFGGSIRIKLYSPLRYFRKVNDDEWS